MCENNVWEQCVITQTPISYSRLHVIGSEEKEVINTHFGGNTLVMNQHTFIQVGSAEGHFHPTHVHAYSAPLHVSFWDKRGKDGRVCDGG